MTIDYWSLTIILLALLIGWVAGWLSRSNKLKKSSSSDLSNCSDSYILGLNYLLANKSDKAIELFIDLIKVDKETMETHLALGNLFRSKGEVDRAITIHQNLIARPNLDQNQRLMAISELAEDYLKAGLLDRAENLFKELVQINPKNASAHRKLLELYSLEKSWVQARDSAQVLFDMNEPESKLILTHCYCEIAEKYLNEGNLRETRSLLKKAILIDERCIRAKLLLIDVHLNDNNLPKATQLIRELVKVSPQYVELYLKAAKDIFLIRGSTSMYQQFLMQQYNKQPTNSVALDLLKSYLETEKHELLMVFLKRALKHSESVMLLDFAFQYFKARPLPLNEIRKDLSDYFLKMENLRIAFICHVCGYKSQSMNWNCPSCKSWSSSKPV